MDDLGRLETTVEQLRQTIFALERRIDALEQRTLTADGTVLAGVVPDGREAANRLTLRNPRDPIFIITLIGRMFLVLAGGFFLRAMTEADVLAAPVGVASAFIYGLAWLVMADRAARRQQWMSAVFHVGGAAIVVFPLLIEATLRFEVLDGTSSALVLAIVTAAFLHVAWRQRLHPVAWIAVVGALPTAAMLLVQTGVVAPFALYFIALGTATFWLAHAFGWTYLPWLPAVAADLAVVGVTLRAVAPEHRDPLVVAMLMQLLLLVAYFSSIGARTLGRGGTATGFEIAQSFAALFVGLGGAIYLAGDSSVPGVVGAASLVAAAAGYALAVVRLDRRGGPERNVHFYAAVALALTLVGCTLVLGARGLGVASSVLAVLASLAWSRSGRVYWLLHATVYVVAAGIASGALGYCGLEIVGSPTIPLAWPDPVMLVVLVASAVAAWFAAAQVAQAGRAHVKALKLVIILVSVWVASGCIVGFVAPLAGVVHDGAVDLGALATVRTAVLAIGTLLVAWFGRHVRFKEWAWIVYPLLVGVGLKMIAQDFKYSRPATLFIALALYGAALIIAPRLRRTASSPAVATGPAVADEASSARKEDWRVSGEIT